MKEKRHDKNRIARFACNALLFAAGTFLGFFLFALFYQALPGSARPETVIYEAF